jgi:hypothetical protein
MKKWHQKWGCAMSFGNTEIKKSLLQIAHLRCCKSRYITIGNLNPPQPCDMETNHCFKLPKQWNRQFQRYHGRDTQSIVL